MKLQRTRQMVMAKKGVGLNKTKGALFKFLVLLVYAPPLLLLLNGAKDQANDRKQCQMGPKIKPMTENPHLSRMLIVSRFVASALLLAKALDVPLVNDLGYTKRYMRCLQAKALTEKNQRDLQSQREQEERHGRHFKLECVNRIYDQDNATV